MSLSRQKLVEDFLLSFRANGQMLVKQVQTVLEVEKQIQFAEFVLLKMLDKHGELSQKEIAQKLYHSEAAISRQVALALEKGHIEIGEDPDNRRASMVTLSRSGKQTLESIDQKIVKSLQAALSDLTDAELQAMLSIHSKIHHKLFNQAKPKEADGS